jgi:Tol biopolymer transport system component
LGISISVSANRVLPQNQDSRDPEIIHTLITGNPSDFFRAQEQSTPQLTQQWQPDPMPTAWSRLAFQSFRYDNWDIYLVHPSDAGEVRLTNHTATESYPSLAKGGERVTFSSNRSGNNDIYLQNADGSGLTVLVSGPANEIYPVWAPDNSRVAFQSDAAGNYDIYVTKPDGATQLTANTAYDGEPTWSPDGTQIAFVSDRSGSKEIWVMNADGSNPHQLTTGGTAATPAWSPRGDQIAYATDHNQDGFYSVFYMNADGSNPTRVNVSTYGYNYYDQWNPVWSPDGKWLALVETSWLKYYPANSTKAVWYWYDSKINFYEISSQRYLHILSDNLAWKVSWTTTDVTPPEPCTITLRPYQGWESFFVSWSAFDAPAGISTYDVQVRDLPDGTWRDLLSDVPQSTTIYPGHQGGRYEFRCRGRDMGRNAGAWEKATPQSTQVEIMYPSSQINALPRYTQGSQVTLSWTGPATAGGAASYDIFVRDGEQGDWIAWRRGITQKTVEFSGTPGHTYFFRSQAHDAVSNHTQVWQPDAQAMTTLYSGTLTLQASDTRGNRLPAPNFSLTPPTIFEISGQSPFEKRLVVASPVRITASAPGFGTIPDTTLNLSGDQQLAYVLPPADDQISNGGFEAGTLTGWATSGDGASISGTAFHTGQAALRLTPGSGGSSELTQVVALAAGLQQPTFSFLYHFIDNPGNAEFSVEVVGTSQRSVLSTQALTSGWTHVWTDLSDFAGQTVTLRFRLSGPAATIALDEVTLGSWKTPLVESVTPSQWEARQAQTIAITGQNFASIPQVFLNNTALTNVEWLDAGHLQAKTPSGMLGGYYYLRVVNPDGIASLLPTPILLSPMPALLPFAAKPGSPPVVQALAPSNWLTLGSDVQHSGYAPNQPSTARYALAWSTNLKYIQKQVVAADGILVAVQDFNGLGGIFAYDLDSGVERWHFTLNAKNDISPASISNGAVYFQQGNNDDTFLYCLDLYTGQIIWKTFMPYWVHSDFHPLVAGQKVYLDTNMSSTMFIYDAASGALLNRVGVPQVYNWSPAYADGKVYTWLAAATYPYSTGFFREHDPVSGEVNWTLTLPWSFSDYNMSTTPVISKRTAFIVSTEFFAAINLDTHAVLWSISGNYGRTSPAVSEDVVYVIRSEKLEARKVSTGELLGTFSAPGNLIYAPVITNSDVYVSSANATYMLDRTTLKVKWTAPEGGWLSVANGYLFIANPEGPLSVYRSQ